MSNILPLLPKGDPILSGSNDLVTWPCENLAALVRAMHVAMAREGGVGLAAPQVGISRRIAVAGVGGEKFTWINPRVVAVRGGRDWLMEGCLSLPGEDFKIPRWLDITAEWYDVAGDIHVERLKGLLAQVFQHEVDHLLGILIGDRSCSKTLS